MAEESLEDKYARLLRDGNTSEATKVAQQLNNSKTEVQESSDSEEEEESDELVSEQERFADLNGVGEELAEDMVDVFGDYDSFVEEADVESLSDISGIGESRAESLLEQVE